MPIEIYLKGDRTYLKRTDANGKSISLKSTTKPRTLETIIGGVVIKPDGDEDSLNNEQILISELVDNFGATTPEELIEAIGEKNFFKKGGGGGLGGKFLVRIQGAIVETLNKTDLTTFQIGDLFTYHTLEVYVAGKIMSLPISLPKDLTNKNKIKLVVNNKY